MIMEGGFDGGYASSYGGVMVIDRHLYSTIPATDFRRKCWVDFTLDGMTQENAINEFEEITLIIQNVFISQVRKMRSMVLVACH